jgi:hypothetical protein
VTEQRKAEYDARMIMGIFKLNLVEQRQPKGVLLLFFLSACVRLQITCVCVIQSDCGVVGIQNKIA